MTTKSLRELPVLCHSGWSKSGEFLQATYRHKPWHQMISAFSI